MTTLYFTKRFTRGVLKGININESMPFVSVDAAAEFLKVMRKGSKRADWKIVDASFQKYDPRRRRHKMTINPKELRRVMSALGKVGGSKSSDRKTKAARKNAKKPRPMRWKYCPKCEAGLSETDKLAGYCAQCGGSLKNQS